MHKVIEIWGKLRTNLGKVIAGFDGFSDECKEQSTKIMFAWSHKEDRLIRRVVRVLHHVSGYREAALQHLYKLWFYTFWPKWGLVAFLIWGWPA